MDEQRIIALLKTGKSAPPDELLPRIITVGICAVCEAHREIDWFEPAFVKGRKAAKTARLMKRQIEDCQNEFAMLSDFYRDSGGSAPLHEIFSSQCPVDFKLLEQECDALGASFQKGPGRDTYTPSQRLYYALAEELIKLCGLNENSHETKYKKGRGTLAGALAAMLAPPWDEVNPSMRVRDPETPLNGKTAREWLLPRLEVGLNLVAK